jgi:hypothetical protein
MIIVRLFFKFMKDFSWGMWSFADDIDDRWRHAAVPANPPKYQPPSEPAPVKVRVFHSEPT